MKAVDQKQDNDLIDPGNKSLFEYGKMFNLKKSEIYELNNRLF